MSQSIDEQDIINKIDDIENNKLFKISSYDLVIVLWMLSMSFAAAGFIWYGIVSWDYPLESISNIGVGCWIILLAVIRSVSELKMRK